MTIETSFRLGTVNLLGIDLDALKVIQAENGVVFTSLLIARDSSGKIIRNVESSPETWEPLTDEQELLAFQKFFTDRDRFDVEKQTGGTSSELWFT